MLKLPEKLIEKINKEIILADESGRIKEACYFPPSKRTIKIGKDTYFLPFPYVIIALARFNDSYCIFADDLENPHLYSPPLPNVSCFTVCLDYNVADINEAVRRFWGYSFSSYRSWDDNSEDEKHRLFETFKKKTVRENLETWSKIPLEEITQVKWDQSECF